MDFTLPELGENITTGDVLRVLVNPGDTLAKDQPVLELETDKATIEVPSSVAGQVKDVKVKAGDKVKVGQSILTVDDGAGGSKPAAAPASAPAAQPARESQPTREAAVGANTAAKVPDDGGLEQHVEGGKHEPAADKAGAVPRDQADAADAEAAAPRQKVGDINRGARPASEPAAAAMP